MVPKGHRFGSVFFLSGTFLCETAHFDIFKHKPDLRLSPIQNLFVFWDESLYMD